MRAATLLLAAALLVTTAHAEDPATSAVSVDVSTPRSTYFVHETVPLTVHVGYDAEYFAEHAVQPFRKTLDVPLRVYAEWWDELPNAIPVVPNDGAGSPSFALNDEVVHGRPGDSARRLTVLDVSRSCRPSQPGDLVLSAPTVQFTVADEFRESFIDGRVAVEPRNVSVAGAALTLSIQPLPEDGRPASFNGAVGALDVRAASSATEVAVGDTFQLELHVSRDADLNPYEPPRLDELSGFHVYGFVARASDDGTAYTYDLAALSGDVTEIPAIPLSYFDPEAAVYRTVSTEPLPLTVRGGDREPVAAPVTKAPERPTYVVEAIALAILIGVLSMLALVWRLRVAERTARARMDNAHSRFKRLAADPACNIADAFASYLAERLGTTPAAVVTPGLADRLSELDVPRELADRAAHHLEHLIAERYGGAPVADGHAVTLTLVEQLDS